MSEALDGQSCALALRPVGQLGKSVLQSVMRRRAERMIKDRLSLQPGEAVVAPAVEFQHIKLLFEERDERQKPLALQTMLVELVRRAVRGGDNHHPGVEERGEQSFEDHRVGDVVDRELVETQ